MKHEDIPDMLGRVLSGTKFGVRQTRGKFGLGAKMALIWSKVRCLPAAPGMALVSASAPGLIQLVPAVGLAAAHGSADHLEMHGAADAGLIPADEHGHACGSLERTSWAELHLVLQAGHRHPQVSLVSSATPSNIMCPPSRHFRKAVAHNERAAKKMRLLMN